MSGGILGRRYAGALFALAREDNKVDRVGTDLRDFARSWAENKQLRSVFENPGFSSEVRRQILRDLAAQAGMDGQVRDMLLLLADRRRLGYVEDVVSAYERQAAASSGQVTAEVTSAGELPESYFAELRRTLQDVTGKQVVVKRNVDPSLIGGVVTRIGDRVFDGSIRNRLSELKDELLR